MTPFLSLCYRFVEPQQNSLWFQVHLSCLRQKVGQLRIFTQPQKVCARRAETVSVQFLPQTIRTEAKTDSPRAQRSPRAKAFPVRKM